MIKYFFIILVLFSLIGCASLPKPVTLTGPIVPPHPKAVMIDNGRYDINKYPNTKWIKEPKTDTAKRVACWSYKDVETLSESLTEWIEWADVVEETLRLYTESLKGKEVRQQ